MRRLLVLVSLLIVFFGSATVAVAQARQIVSIADNAVLASPGAFIDFPAVDVRSVSEVSLLGKTTTGGGLVIFVKFSTVPGVFGDSVPAAAATGGGSGCQLEPVAGVLCVAPMPFKVAGPFMLIRAVSPGSAQTFTLDAFMVK